MPQTKSPVAFPLRGGCGEWQQSDRNDLPQHPGGLGRHADPSSGAPHALEMKKNCNPTSWLQLRNDWVVIFFPFLMHGEPLQRGLQVSPSLQDAGVACGKTPPHSLCPQK